MTHAPAPSRYASRSLDERGERTDVCPTCGGERRELVLPPHALFYCPECEASTSGPNDTYEPPVEATPALFSVSDLAVPVDEPPPDEGMAWVGEEGPDE